MSRLRTHGLGNKIGECQGNKGKCTNDAFFWVHDTSKGKIYRACHAHRLKIETNNFMQRLASLIDNDKRLARTNSIAARSFIHYLMEGVSYRNK